MVKKTTKSLGAWAFLIGVVLAIVLGLFSSKLGPDAVSAIVGLLVIGGIIIGLFNISSKETSKFLLASLSLVIVSFLGYNALSALDSITYIGPMLGDILNYLLILFVPTTIIVALKSLFELPSPSLSLSVPPPIIRSLILEGLFFIALRIIV